MGSINKSVRVGAAAFALGMSLAGPQALGVASAEGPDSDAASVSAGPPDGDAASSAAPGPSRRAARAARLAEAASPTPPSSVAAATEHTPAVGAARAGRPARSTAPRTKTRIPGSGVLAGPSAAKRPATTATATAVALSPAPAAAGQITTTSVVAPGPASAATLSPVAAVASPTAAQTCGSCWAFGALATAPAAVAPVRQAVSTVAFAVERLIDGVGRWLSGLPANPITNVLSGGLWLVRRTLFPVGADVGLWGAAACVTTGDCSNKNLSHADLSKLPLTEVRFTNAILNWTNFYGSNLTRADFTGADTRQADFEAANLTDANLTGTDLGYMNLLGTRLTGANLTNAKLVGARLWGQTATDLATATLVGADFTGQRFSSGNGTTLNWAGKNLTGVKLRGANMTGADLSRANLTGADFDNVNLTRANLTDVILPGASFLSPILSATSLVGANLTRVDLSGGSLAGKDLTGTILDGAKLARMNLKGTNLTGANLQKADLTGTDLTGANLTRADLFKGNLADTTLTRVTWRDTNCQYGGKTSKGCSTVALLDQPPADWLAIAAERRPGPGKFYPWQWYQYSGPGKDPAYDVIPPPILRGTMGAPMVNQKVRDSEGFPVYGHDGILGSIYNDSNQRIVVRTPIDFTSDGQARRYWSTAVLDPGDSMSYQLDYVERNFSGGDLQFLRYDNGQTTGDPAKLYLGDSTESNKPITTFTPPGYTDPFNVRTSWDTETQASEVWGDIRIDVRRELNGWQVTGSDTYLEYYKFTASSQTSDWPVFTIKVKGL